MEKIINEIYNKMFVYFGESIEMYSMGDINSSEDKKDKTNHKSLVHNLIVKHLDVKDNKFDPNAEIHDNLSTLSLSTNFLSFVNATYFYNGEKFTAIIIYLTKGINEDQKFIVSKCLEQLKKDNVYTEIGGLDKGKLTELSPDKLDEYFSKDQPKVLERVNQ